MNSSYEEKIKTIFPGLVVQKSLASSQEITKIPRFISEYLIQKLSEQTRDEKEIAKRVAEFLGQYRPEHKDREWLKSRILEEGSVKVLDFFDAYTDLEEAIYYADIPLMGIRDVVVPQKVKNENENLLRGGMWGLGTIGFARFSDDMTAENDAGILKKLFESKQIGEEHLVLTLLKFVPFQFTRCDIKYFMEARSDFELDEWLEMLINTIGLNPSRYPSFKEKLILLTRLVPFVEENIFIVELGEPGTGKTFLFDKLSGYSRVISGSVETPANLFFHGAKRKPGILATSDVVLFDEIDKVGNRKMDPEVVGKLFKFMESGVFDRAGQEISSSASVVFGGNLKEFLTPLYLLFPKEMQHKAFFDRVHGFIPGEVLSRIGKSEEFVSSRLGLTSDYFSEILHRLRRISFAGIVKAKIKIIKGDARDEKPILKITSALLKLLYPHLKFSTEEFKALLDYAVEMRNKSIKEIKIMDPQANVREVEVEVVE